MLARLESRFIVRMGLQGTYLYLNRPTSLTRGPNQCPKAGIQGRGTPSTGGAYM